ncbi:MAG: hypothetical protein AAB507_01230 [Patescibacteria group bacterium]
MSSFFSKQIIFVLVFILIAVGAIFVLPKKAETPTTIKEVKTEDATIKGTGDFTIEQIPIENIPKAPSLDRPVYFNANLSEEVKKILTDRISADIAMLKKNIGDIETWILLGADYKAAGDYGGARLAWEYANAIRPANYVSFSNLGDLCHFYLKDYPCAEKNLLISIKNEPAYIAGYRALYDLYALSYKEKFSEAPKILLKGLAVNPKSVDLMILLAQYYRDTGDKGNALLYYDKAIALLTTAGDTARLEAVKSDRTALIPLTP